MLNVLICGPNFFNFTTSIGDAFTELGWDTHIETYDNPVHPFNGWNKWRHKFSQNKEKFKCKNRRKYHQYITQVFDQLNPSLVFIANGDIFDTYTLDYFRSKSKVIIWLFDTIKRYPRCINHIDHVDAFFCFEQADIDYYNSIKKDAKFIPQACDAKIYQPIKNIQKDIDILFIGNLYNYRKRIEYMEEIVKCFPNYKILIFGIYKPYYKNLLKWLFREKKNIYMNRNIDRNIVNQYYNRAKVVLNIHHELSENSANPKVFEICGAGAYQICDTNPFIESLFPNGEIGLYHNKKEFVECIKWALDQNNEKIKKDKAEQSHYLIMKEHTFKDRIEDILKNTFK